MTPTIKMMFIIILLLILGLLHTITQMQPTTEPMSDDSNTIKANSVPQGGNNYDSLSAGPMVINNPIENELAIRQYDYNKVYDILENPARRVPRNELPPQYVKRLIDYPTRGYPDNYTQYGILKRISHRPTSEHEHEHSDQSNNFIIRLFGRQEFPGSNKFEYYTMINNGFDQIKIPIYSRKQELYDGDEIFLKELDSKYIILLYDYDEPKYYPDLVY